MACPRCRHDHPPVSFTAWAWAVRDAKDKPPAGQIAVVLLLGTRLQKRRWNFSHSTAAVAAVGIAENAVALPV